MLLIQKEKEIKHLEKKLLNKNEDINKSANSSYSNLMNINSNNLSSIRLNLGTNNKKEKYSNISLLKKSALPIEKLKIQEKLNEHRKIINKKMNDIIRNKSLCNTYRNKSSSKSKDNYTLDKINKNNISTLISNNSNYFNKKINEISSHQKKEKKYINKNKIFNSSFILERNFINNANKDYFGTQESSKNYSNTNSKNTSFSKLNLRQLIFSNNSNKKNKKNK